MRLEELQKLVAKGESEDLEFKKTTGQRTEAAKTVCALDFFRNSIYLLKLLFLAAFRSNFSTMCTHMLSKFDQKSAQKSSIFPSKASFERSLLLNGLGGFVLFGISDNGEITGQQVSAKTIEDIVLELRKIEPPAFPELETVALEKDRAVIVIRVSGNIGAYCYDGRTLC